MAGNESYDLGLGRRDRQSVTERLADIQAGAPLAGEAPKPKTIQDISIETGVPWNVIETVVRDSGVAPEQSLALAQDFAQKMKQEIDKGRDIPGAMRSIFGDDAPIEDALKRAVDLAGGSDEGRGASGQNNDNSFAEDFGRSVAGGAISGIGAIAEGAGTLLDVDDLFGNPGITDWAETAGRAVGDTLRGWGQNVKDGMSDDAKRAVRNSTPDGKLFEPSTWKFEGDVSAQGIALLTADVLGSLAPVVIAGIFTGGVGGAAVGGLQGAGAGAQTGRDIVDRATPEQLEANSSYYNELIAKGMTPEAAKEKVKDAAGSLSAVLTAPVSAFGGAFTGRLVNKGIGALSTKGAATRIAGTAAVAGAEEGTQEVLEGVFARTGAEMASGLPVDQMEGTFGEFVLGALGGGVIGAGRGAMPSDEQDQTGEAAPDAPLGLPAPDPQLPAPEGGAPDALDRPPLGVLARAAQAAPKPVEPDAPFPALNAQAGQPVRVTLRNGMVVDAEFVGEDEAGVSLKVNGEPALITRERMEQDGIQIAPVDVITETAWADVETDAATNFEPLDDTTEPPQQRAERLQGALDTYLTEQKIDTTPEDRAEIANSIDRFGGTIQQAVADFQAEMQMEALAQEAAAITENVRDTNVSQMENESRTNNAENSPTTEAPADLPAAQTKEGGLLTEAPATAQTQNDGTAWGAMTPAQREALLVSVGFADRDGNLNAPGRRAAGKGWDDLSERVREKLGEKIDPQAQAGAPVAPGADPNRGLEQNKIAKMLGKSPIVYHGTGAREYDLKDASFPMHFTEDKATAEDFAKNYDDAEGPRRVIEAMLDAANVLVADDAFQVVNGRRVDLQNLRQDDLAHVIDAGYDAIHFRKWGEWVALTKSALKPVERPTRTQPGVNVLPDGEEPIALPGSVAAAATETEENPTEGQKEAENYKTGKADWQGLKLSIENRKGSERSKKTPDGKTEWSVTMPAHYGRILRTKGADGDHVDFYMGDNEDSTSVWVIDQMDLETGRFDEHKVMLGFDDASQAGETYKAGFSDGKGSQRLGGIKKMSVEEFKAWLADGDTTKPVTPKATRDDKDAQSRQDAPDTLEGGDLNAGIRNAEAEGQGGQEEVNSAPEQGVGEKTSPNLTSKRLTTRGDGRAAGEAWAKQGKPENMADDPAMGNAASDARGGWVAGYRAAKQEIQANETIGPSTETAGPFGPVIQGYEGDWKGAALELERRKTGEAPAALSHPDVGPIALVWGKEGTAKSDGFGLAKLIAWHPEVLDDLQGRLLDAEVVSRTEGRIQLRSNKDNFGIRLQFDGQNKTWLLTAFERGSQRTERSSSRLNDLWNGSLSPSPLAQPEDSQNDAEIQEPVNSESQTKPSILSALSDEKQARAAELKRRLAEKARNQTSSGLDPEYITLGGELVALYIEAGTKRFAEMLRDFADTTGLSMREAQAPMRAAYNHVRDDMDLAGQDVSDMDDAQAVMAEVRRALAEEDAAPEEVQTPPEDDTLEPQTPETTDEQRGNQEGDQGEPESEEPQEGMGPVGEPDGEPADDGRGEGDEDGAGTDADNDEGGSLGDRPGSVLDGQVDQRAGTPPANFIITDDFALGQGTDGEKLAANMAALRLVDTLEKENRYATPEEQETLARWVGWGGLKTVFDGKHEGTTTQWGRAQAELKELLTVTEYADAMRSANDAHYTSRTVVKAMWRAMRNFGFEGGRALEPTIGSGNFLGLQPADLSENTEWFAAELDPVTGKIAKHLYPQAQVFDGTGFQDAPFRRAAFDVAIGNPPFGSTKIGNKALHPDLGKLSVHNFIIAKTGQLLREGGVMGMVVTHRFLDAPNPEARAKIAPDFRFLGAIRLPNTAFQENAGTEVTTDIVFFQKRREGDTDGDTTWLETDVEGPNGTRLNRYFAENPDMILGRAAMDGTMYARGREPNGKGEFTVHADGRDLEAALNEAIDRIEATIPTREEALEGATTARENSSTLPYGAMMLAKDGRIFRGDEDADGNRVVQEVTADTFWKDNAEAQGRVVKTLRAALDGKARGVTISERLDLEQEARDAAQEAGLIDLAGDPVKQSTKFETALADNLLNLMVSDAPRKDALAALDAYEKAVDRKRLGTDGFDRLSAILNLRQRTRELIALERSDAPEPQLAARRRGLRNAYRKFQRTYGYINNSKNEAILRGDVGPEFALEIGYKAATKDGREETATEAPILEKRVIYPHKLPDNVESVADGLHVSMQERGYIDPAMIAELTGKDQSDVLQELVSGAEPLAFKNPKTGRFEMAEVYLSGNLAEKIKDAQDAGLYQNVPHLENAMPPPKTQDQITPSIRSLWIPPSVFGDFLKAMGYGNPTITLLEAVGMSSIEADEMSGLTEFGRQFDTERMSAFKIFDHAIKGKIPVVYDTVQDANGNSKRVKNEPATREAVGAYERMSREFPQWAYANPQRAGQIVDAFNEKMNVVTERRYQGVRYLRMVGNSPEISLRNSQKNGAWRMIQDKVTLLHHVVGAGKTFTAIAGVMERKRMGLSRKAVVAVPNHLTGQWGREWLELYPAANILVPTEKDFEPANRAKLINRIATGDFDAVIVGHSQLTKIENDPAVTSGYIEQEITELNAALQEAKRSGESKRTVGQIGTRLNNLKTKLKDLEKKLADRADNKVLGWQDLGVDYLVVDEAHLFKNLEYTTTASQLVGMNPPGGSQRAFDMLMKVRTLQGMRSGGVSFLTGTPVSNSLVEIYAMMKYLVPESLEAMNIQSFDSWKAAFIEDQSRFEYTASMQLKERNVMSGMINLGPLAQLYRSFADIVMRPDVERMYREQKEAENAAQTDPEKIVSTRFPTPKVKGGARQINLAPPTEKMQEFVRYLVMRMAGIKKNKSDKKYMSTDNPLWVLTDARKASVDIRTIDPTLGREEGSKVERASDEVFRIWEANKERKGTQMVFSDMSAPTKTAEVDAKRILKLAYEKLGLKRADITKRAADEADMTYAERWGNVIEDLENAISSPDTDEKRRDRLNEFAESEAVQDASSAMFTADTGFSFYDDMKAALIEKGVPEKEIAFIHDYNTTIKKAELFEAVNEGAVRVLIGSTQKMGAGTNAQKRMVALHHIDAPWRPSDMEQREGRIIRQGNLFYKQDPDGFEVEIIAYSTEQTADVVQWQVLERKASSIETFLNAATDSIEEEGGDADQYAEFMAQSTGKEVFLQKMQAEKDRDTEQARIASTIRNLAEAERYLASYDLNQDLLGELADTYKTITPGVIGDGADTYLSGWEAEAEAYRAEKNRIEAERDKVRARNADKPRKEWEKLPELPSAPSRWEERPAAGWERKVYDVLSEAQNTGMYQTIPLTDQLELRINASAETSGAMSYAAYIQPIGSDATRNEVLRLIDGFGTVEAKDFRRSDKLLNALSPANIVSRAETRAARYARDKQRHAELKPQMESIKEKGVDRAPLEAAQQRLDRLSALVRIEEVKFATETASAGPNYFAARDDKGRDLVADNTAQPLTGQFQFTNAGQNYASEWGAPGGTRRIEGTDRSGRIVFFEAENMDTGEQVVIEAIETKKAEGDKPAEWDVLNVYDNDPLSDMTPEELERLDRALTSLGITSNKVEDEMRLDDDGNPNVRASKAKRAPVATLTGKELGEWSDVLQLGRKANKWYRDNLQGQSAVNEATGWTVQFSGAGGRKISGRKGEDLLRIVPALREIVSKGRVVATEPDKRGRPEVKAIHKIAARVTLDGADKDVVTTIREAQNGTFYYDLNTDVSDGARFSLRNSDEATARMGSAQVLDPALEVGPASLNLEIDDGNVKARRADFNAAAGDVITSTPEARKAMRKVRRALRDELNKIGIGARITLDVREGVIDTFPGIGPMDGYFLDGVIGIAADTPGGYMGVLRHEVIHALRNPELWGKDHGLFTAQEWRTLVRAARQNTRLMDQVNEDYEGLSEADKIEEVIAEMFREWSDGKDTQTALGRALDKLRQILDAIITALRGEGLNDAAAVFERIRSGEIGGRGPEGPGGGADVSPVKAKNAPQVFSDVFRRDNPGGSWLEGKKQSAIDYAKNSRGAVSKLFTGAVTGYHTGTIELPVDVVSQLRGANDERRSAGETQFDRLRSIVDREGWKPTPILIGVNQNGKAYILEGNTRVSIAKQDGVSTIPAEVRYWNGGEDKSGPMSPAELQKIAKIPRSDLRAKIATPRDAGRISVQARNLRAGISQLASDAVTNAMKDRGGYNTLALVPGRALFNELGKGIPAAKRYLRLKEKMDTKRNDKHSETDEVAQKWRKLANKDQEANAELMKLMHDSTIAGVDPSERFVSPMGPRDELIIKSGRVANPIAYEAALERKERHERLQKAHDELSPRFKALPEGFQELYRDVRDTYRRLDDEQTAAIIGNVERAMTLAIRRAEREHRRAVETAKKNHAGALRKIAADNTMSGAERATRRAQADMKRDQAIADADEALAKAKATRAWTKDSQVRKLRAQFETNKISGPYFPLARFGEYFVLARDDEGNVQSFSRHETVQQQRAAQKDMEDEGFEVQIGVMQETDARDLVDPAFVADIERMLEEVNADEKLMDDIWQRWLESLPDMSIRKHRIHRKNREGYDADALRAFGHHMFHGSHQLARLLYSLEMQEELDVASEEAASSEDPVRNGFIVNEMKRRHGFTMNPKGAWWASRATSLAFIYYLSVSPAAAIVNLSQTSIVGTSVLGRYGGTKKAAGALTKALADFTRSPKWHSERNTRHLSADERAAMHEAYKRGVIDKTQSHDLAQVAESGVEYDAKWVNVMSKISWLFHHSERMNREVTFLAGYRLLREQGKTHEQAITQAGDATWEVHFDYQNTSKPRVMQSPGMQVLLTFRNFSVNFLWRIFRDLHQAVNGADADTRKEARRQAGVMASMMLFHAGIKGIYGYGLVMALLGMFFPDDEDDPEERLEKLMLDYLPRPVARAMLDGVPGTLGGIDLTGRIGMPNLWFRDSLRPLEGADLYQHYVNEVIGPIPAIGMNIATGASRVIDGAALRDGSLVWRGVETAMPKAVRDVMKGGRYAYEGALTYNGDPIKGDFSAWEVIAQVSGFTPKELADQYDQNGRLKNKERAITDRRRNVIKQAAEQIKDGKPLTARQMRLIEEFNRDYPEWPITNETLNRSVQGRIQRSDRNQAGVSVNPRLEPRLRASLSPLVADG